MLQIIVLSFAVNSFRITIEGVFTIVNNYSLFDEGISKFCLNSWFKEILKGLGKATRSHYIKSPEF